MPSFPGFSDSGSATATTGSTKTGGLTIGAAFDWKMAAAVAAMAVAVLLIIGPRK